MQGKPIITIDKFSGAGKGGLWFNNGFTVHTEGGTSMLIEDFKQEKVFDSATANFTNLSTTTGIRAIEYLARVGTTSSDNDYLLCADGSSKLYVSDYNAGITDGQILEDYGNMSDYPDLFALPSGNILMTSYTSAGTDYASLLVRGACATGSSTTQIVDADGRNFTTLGVNIGEEITNITTGETYTITAVSTTNSTNDTLEFAAGTACSAGDEFITIDLNAFDLDSGITVPTFIGQDSESDWKRQIVQFDDYQLITNGNYLALLDSDETSFDNAYKQLPFAHQAMAIAVNGNKIAVTTKTARGQGFILLWDGYSDGWLNIKPIEGIARAVQAYKNGFVYVTNGRLSYTNGYDDVILGEYADTNDMSSTLGNLSPSNFNGLTVSNNMVFLVTDQYNHNRVFGGIYYWNQDYGWGYMPTVSDDVQYWGDAEDVTSNREYIAQCIYKNENYDRIDVGHKNGLNKITDNGETTATSQSKSFIFYTDLPLNQQIKEIGLNIGVNPKYYSQTAGDTQCKIAVNIGDGRHGITKYFKNIALSSTTTIANTGGATQSGYTGKEVVITGTYGASASAGNRTYITSIAGKGTSSEVWTVSPALSASRNVAACTAIQYMLDPTATKTISIDDIHKEQIFNTEAPVLGNKLIIEVVVYGVANSFPVAIQGINIYG